MTREHIMTMALEKLSGDGTEIDPCQDPENIIDLYCSEPIVRYQGSDMAWSAVEDIRLHIEVALADGHASRQPKEG